MEPDTSEHKKAPVPKMFFGIIAFLGLAFLLQTAYLFHIKTSEQQVRDELLARKSVIMRQDPTAGHWGSVLPQGAPAFQASAAGPMTEDWADPFAEMERMQEHMNRMFHRSMRHFLSTPGTFPGLPATAVYEPDLDIQDKGDHYLIRLDLPGLEKDQIRVDVTENALTVSGERRSEKIAEDAPSGFYRSERSFGAFHRQIPLPEDVTPEGVTAEYESGVLQIKIQKVAGEEAAKKEPQRVDIR